MYLNHGKIATQRILYGILTVVFTALSLLFVLGIILTLTGYSDPSSNMTLIIYMTFLFILGDILCIKALVKTFKAGKISRILSRSQDGLIAIEQVAETMHLTQEKFVKLFIDCVSRALLVRCTLFAEDPTFILLENGAKDITQKFAVIHCKQCSGPNAIQIGFRCRCKYCGTEDMV